MQVPSYGGNRNRENWVRPVFSFDHQSGSITFFLVHFFLAHLDQIAFSPIDNDIGDDRYYRYRGRSLIRFPLLSRIIQRSEPTQVVAFHSGGKVTAGSTCSVLLRRNYFPNSICSKFGPVRIFYESFLREIHFPMTVPNKVCPTLSWLIFNLYDAHSDLCT